MKPQMRRILAYVVARLVADTDSSLLYDYQENAYFNFNGEVNKKTVKVLDYTTSVYLKGTGKEEGSTVVLDLYYFGTSSSILLTIDLSTAQFSGIGRGKTVNFHGTADKSGKISFFDSSTGMYYKLKV